MNVVSDRFKTFARGGGRKFFGVGQKASIFVRREIIAFKFAAELIIGVIPLGIDNDVLPTEFFEILRHVVGGSFHFFFGHETP